MDGVNERYDLTSPANKFSLHISILFLPRQVQEAHDQLPNGRINRKRQCQFPSKASVTKIADFFQLKSPKSDFLFLTLKTFIFK